MTNDVTADLRAVETTWDPTLRDFRRALLLILGDAQYYILAAVAVALGLIGTVLGIETTDDHLVIPTLWLAPALLFAAVCALAPRLVVRRMWNLNPLAELREHVRVDASGVTSSSELAMTRLSWAALTVAHETDHVFVVATKKGTGACLLIVPKDDLSHDELMTVRALILKNVGSIR